KYFSGGSHCPAARLAGNAFRSAVAHWRTGKWPYKKRMATEMIMKDGGYAAETPPTGLCSQDGVMANPLGRAGHYHGRIAGRWALDGSSCARLAGKRGVPSLARTVCLGVRSSYSGCVRGIPDKDSIFDICFIQHGQSLCIWLPLVWPGAGNASIAKVIAVGDCEARRNDVMTVFHWSLPAAPHAPIAASRTRPVRDPGWDESVSRRATNERFLRCLHRRRWKARQGRLRPAQWFQRRRGARPECPAGQPGTASADH